MQKIKNICYKNMFLKLSKVLYVVLILYMAWFQAAFFTIKRLSLVLGVLQVLFLLLHLLTNKVNLKRTFPRELNIWLLFGFIAIIFGLINAKNKLIHLDSSFTYFQYTIVIWSIFTISLIDKKNVFFVNTFIMLAIISAFSVLIFPYNYGGNRITLGPNNNPNTLGIVMAYGIGFVLFQHNYKKRFQFIILFLLSLLFLYVTILTGSRKSIISIFLIFFFWLFFIVIPQIREGNIINRFKRIYFLVILIIVLVSFSLYMLKDSVLWIRLINLSKETSGARVGMYYEAIDIFKKYPIVGVGMNQFSLYSSFGAYSHSTFAEILANTGLIGFFLYFMPYLIIGLKLYKLSFTKNLIIKEIYDFRFLFIIFIMVVFLAFSLIHIYTLSTFIFFGITLSNIYLMKKENIILS